MVVKQKNTKLSLAKIAGNYLNKRKYLLKGILGAGTLMGLAGIFFAVLSYGAYLSKIGRTTYSKPLLIKISEMDFSFLRNLGSPKGVEFSSLKLDIPGEELARIQVLRKKAVEEGMITTETRAQEFPARLNYKDKTFEVKISLTGMMARHLQDPSRLPLEVKVIGTESIDGMKRFALLLPSTGEYLSEWLSSEMLTDRNIFCMKGDFVQLAVNGKKAGIFYLQERFDEKLFETKRFGQGLLFGIEDGLTIYGEEKLLPDSQAKGLVSRLKKMWDDLNDGVLPAGRLFDLEKMGKLSAISDLMNHDHPMLRKNLRFHFNPNTGLAEPIATGFKNLNTSNPAKFASLLEKPNPESKWQMALSQDPVISKISDQLEFKRFYIEEAEMLVSKEFVENFLKFHGDKLTALMKKEYRNWPSYDLPVDKLNGNRKHLFYVLYPDKAEIAAWFAAQKDDDVHIALQNQQDLPLEILSLSWRDSIFFYPESPVIIDGQADTPSELPGVYSFKIPASTSWADSLLPELKLYYNVVGMQSPRRTVVVFPWSYGQRMNMAVNPAAKNENYKDFGFVKEKGETIYIPSGKWVLSKDLIIPKNRRFELHAGAQIDLINNSRILSFSPVYGMGTQEHPILIKSSDATSEGLLVMRAQERSKLVHTYFEKLSRPNDSGWFLPGAVTFYESPVDIISCKFIDNKIGDDYLNIVRSDFFMDQTTFEKINADAFDCDFCTGTVSNSYFTEVGNDGIDVSGSQIEVINVRMEFIGDKGLSAGENSQMIAKGIKIANAEIGVTSKDQSEVTLSDSELFKARIGITLFQKKTEFGPGFLNANRVKVEQSEIPYLVEDNSRLILDGNPFFSNNHAVKQILYGVEYGKSSK